MLRMTDTDQEEFVSYGSSLAAYPAPALAMVQKEEAWPFFLEQMHLSQKKTASMTQDSAGVWLLGIGIRLNANL